MKVSYVVTDASVSPMTVKPWLENEENGITSYDGRFYAERLAAALGRITEAFGWNAKELIAETNKPRYFHSKLTHSKGVFFIYAIHT